jgi:hypothetical protein
MPFFDDPVIRLIRSTSSSLDQAFPHLTLPSRHLFVLTTAVDLTRSQAELIAENAPLRLQLIILHRQVKKPRFTEPIAYASSASSVGSTSGT